jgi:hypothetical protein
VPGSALLLFGEAAVAKPHQVTPMEEQDRRLTDDELKAKYAWAVQIVQRHFENGLAEISDARFLDERYEFQHKNDPIYAELLSGMRAPRLAKTFVSYWIIAQTLATRSRFWLEAAVAEIIIHQAKHFGRPALEVYSQAMLGHGCLKQRKPIAEIGEEELEHLTEASRWEVPIRQSALRTIDVLVGEQERLDRLDRPQREPFRPDVCNKDDCRRAKELDHGHLMKVAESLQGQKTELTLLQCNLLVIEPDKGDKQLHAWAIRFVNPKTIAQHAARKQERVNLLRLYALLLQEKITRQPQSVSVCIAALVPRYKSWNIPDGYPAYFSPDTYWTTDRLWDQFIKVPFEVVRFAIHAAARGFRDRLIDGLGNLLPEEIGPIQGDLFQS